MLIGCPTLWEGLRERCRMHRQKMWIIKNAIIFWYAAPYNLADSEETVASIFRTEK
jgi:hypothetical protein